LYQEKERSASSYLNEADDKVNQTYKIIYNVEKKIFKEQDKNSDNNETKINAHTFLNRNENENLSKSKIEHLTLHEQ
jgi:hypothetical protein